MFLELSIFLGAIIFGIFVGTFTGLIPGIHINLIATVLISLPFLGIFEPPTVAIFIVSMAITHTYTDFIPSTFLGAPSEDTSLGVLPGHKFLLKGQGHYALKLTVAGSLIGTFSLIVVVPLLWFFLVPMYPFVQQMMGFFLIWTSIFLLLSSKDRWRSSLLIFLAAGLLGNFSLNLDMDNSILPLLTGLFGSSTLLYSIKSKLTVPKQEVDNIPIMKEDVIKPTIATVFVSPICSVLPGLGSSQAAIIGSQIVKRINREQFLVLLGSINTLVMATSFITLFLLGKTRTGAAVAISEIITISKSELWLIVLAIFITSIIAAIISLKISKLFAVRIHKISYSKISLLILGILTCVVFWFTGVIGILIFTTSTLIGLTCIYLDVRRSFLMGAILIPALIFYLPF